MLDLRVCFLGDSFVQGVGDPQYRGWVGRVLEAVEAVEAVGDGVTAFNLGVRRETSRQVAARCWDEVGRRVAEGADNRLVVSFGANDMVVEEEEEGGRPRVDADEAVANLSAVVRECAARGMPLLVVGPPPVCEGGGAGHLDRLVALAERMAKLCAAEGVPFVDVTRELAQDRTWCAEAAAGDGAHPAAGGYDALARLVLPEFRSWLRER